MIRISPSFVNLIVDAGLDERARIRQLWYGQRLRLGVELPADDDPGAVAALLKDYVDHIAGVRTGKTCPSHFLPTAMQSAGSR